MVLLQLLRSSYKLQGAVSCQGRNLWRVPVAHRTFVLRGHTAKPKDVFSYTMLSQGSRCISTTTPMRSANASGQHSALWTAERALSLGLLGIIPASIAFPSQALDAMLAISIVMHQHWGLEAVVTDYVRPILFGAVIPKVAHGILLLFSIATLGGLFYFIYNDIGIAKSIRKLWSVKGV